ncbi:MAG: sodium-dependent transporter, partial [Fibrobacteres bacterium]|nr:sodium-dependent transporter [Fibrobacterota bacterium]
MKTEKENWGSRIGVILAVSGSAVGLGNFLRFPGQAVDNGGGAFMIPYFVSFLLLGIPVCWIEWSLGRKGGSLGFNSPPGIFQALSGRKSGKYLGVFSIMIPLVIFMYYVYIESWCLSYAVLFATGKLNLGGDPAAYASFFENYVGMKANGSFFSTGHMFAISILLFSFTLNFYLVYRGLQKGIEKFCKIAMPMLIACALVMLVRVLTLGTPDPSLPEQNVWNGLGSMWNPDFSRLFEAKIWLAASGQIFFSLSIGFGLILTYASYVKKDDDIVLSSLTASSTNEFAEVILGGMIIIPAAFVFLGSAPIQKVAGSTLGLGFYTIPVIFHHMPAGQFFGFLWFFLLFLAAVTSSISMLQPSMAFLEEGFNFGRAKSALILAIPAAAGAFLVVYLSKGLVALDTMDFWIGTAAIYVM